MRLVVDPMELEDITQVLEVDRESYTTPWPPSAYRREILHNRNARYLVLREVLPEHEHAGQPDGAERPGRIALPFFRWHQKAGDPRPGRIVGYAGMWIMMDEAHVTTIALRRKWRGQGLGELLLACLVQQAWELGAERLTLEVRVSNDTAQNLYRKYGFRTEGVRPRYYSDNNEDAYIMTTEDIRQPSYWEHFDRLVDGLWARLPESTKAEVVAPAFHQAAHTDRGQGAD